MASSQLSDMKSQIAVRLKSTPFQTLEADRQVGRRRTLLQMDQNFPVITVPIYVAAGAPIKSMSYELSWSRVAPLCH